MSLGEGPGSSVKNQRIEYFRQATISLPTQLRGQPFSLKNTRAADIWGFLWAPNEGSPEHPWPSREPNPALPYEDNLNDEALGREGAEAQMEGKENVWEGGEESKEEKEEEKEEKKRKRGKGRRKTEEAAAKKGARMRRTVSQERRAPTTCE
jgi:hypothetical protein